ncbi:GNAT family N-acetyltransferase [Streptococcus hyovaginalis]|uniref:GNAT family N-acetyltransferase n=1 Tax=Streptococcus hyovaginalis TaxID=149015 RepID=UPI002A7F5C06|nr:GNAT family N-acetyltransferase [Streptococcus hyovaginalis]MDY4510866.1 GNAT family N-acetyltransferase [Streptococcus hyovaginalis]
MLETARLLLRPWTVDDAEDLFVLASDPEIGPRAGWPVHQSLEESRNIIETVFAQSGTYALVDKVSGKPVGAIGLMIGGASKLTTSDKEAELGYWLGRDYWGQGLVPEAIRELLCYAFETLELETIWCGYFEGNEQSRRAQEKCGFTYQHKMENVEFPLIGEFRTEHVTRLTRTSWLESKEK